MRRLLRRHDGRLVYGFRTSGVARCADCTTSGDEEITDPTTDERCADCGEAIMQSEAATARQASELKICPDCAEPVRNAARVCRFCRYRFDEATPMFAATRAADEKPTAARVLRATGRSFLRGIAGKTHCPHCSKRLMGIASITRDPTVCPHCTREIYGPRDPRRR
jgi:hypothetical protein